MPLILVLVFLGVFVVLALVLSASGLGASKKAKQTMAALESALATQKPEETQDEVVDLRKEELLSSIPFINRWLLKFEVAPRLRLLLYQANLKWTAGGLILMSMAAAIVPGYLIYFRTRAVLFGLLVGLATGCVPALFVRFKRQQRFGKFEEGLPEALDLMGSALRAGHSMASAFGLVARESPDPVGGEFRLCFEEQNYGLDMRTAMDNLITRVPLQDLRMFVTAVLIQRESGGNLAEVLDKVGHVVRERFRLKRQVATHTAQGRLTGWILSFLPVALGFALYLINPKTMSILWTRPLGLKLLYLAAGMTLTGGLIIRKIVNMEV